MPSCLSYRSLQGKDSTSMSLPLMHVDELRDSGRGSVILRSGTMSSKSLSVSCEWRALMVILPVANRARVASLHHSLLSPIPWSPTSFCQSSLCCHSSLATLTSASSFSGRAKSIITDGSHAPNGWATPYIPVTFLIGWILIGAFIYVEGWVATQPLLPFDLFDVKGMKPLVLALFFDYGVFGIYLFYASFYIEQILDASPLLTTAYFTPMCVGGLILSTVGGLILHLIPGTL